MNEYLMSKYINKDINKELYSELSSIVAIDNPDKTIAALNDIFEYDWSYDLEIHECVYVLSLFLPGKVLKSFSAIANSDSELIIKELIHKCVMTMINTTKDTKTDVPKTEKKKTGIPEDLVNRINAQIDRLDIIDSDVFNFYIKTWKENFVDLPKEYEDIQTKKDLLRDGFKPLEVFIEWLESIKLSEDQMVGIVDDEIESPI